ncbi:MAG TPA: hypothetical protein VHE35_01995 [Kofleriaceae bacterium]|nr:hypothetical protein [Kofleriaceae bacterium]
MKVYSEIHPGESGAGARVVFAPPGQPAVETLADADGLVEAMIPEGTDVTVAQRAILIPSGEWGTIFTTFVDLGPGASVVAGPRQLRPQIVSNFAVALPAYPGGRFYTLTASCELGGVADQNVLTVSVYGPCATATAATLVGRVKSEQGALLGVTVLEGVDLLAANGTTVTMPPFDVAPVTITATLTNVADITDAVTTFVTYRLGDVFWLLDQAAASTRHGGLVQLAFPAYPVGDQTSFDVTLVHLGTTFADYHHGESGRPTDFTLDASSSIEGILGAVVGADHISWTTTAWGTAPDLVDAKLWSGDVRGVLVAPGDGSSISLDAIPPDLRRPWSADDVELQFYEVDGLGYRDIVPLLEEPMDSGVWPRPPFTWRLLSLPRSLSYWRTSYPLDLGVENGL